MRNRTAHPLSLVSCEIHNPCIHGETDTSSLGISGHFLCFYAVSRYEPFNPLNYPFRFMLQMQAPVGRGVWRVEDTAYWKETQNGARLAPDVAAAILDYGHPFIRNYRSIIEKRGTRMLEIAEQVMLPGDECVCILKTVWLRIFQRRVKKWIQNKKRVAQLLKKTRFLMLRECGIVRDLDIWDS